MYIVDTQQRYRTIVLETVIGGIKNMEVKFIPVLTTLEFASEDN